MTKIIIALLCGIGISILCTLGFSQFHGLPIIIRYIVNIIALSTVGPFVAGVISKKYGTWIGMVIVLFIQVIVTIVLLLIANSTSHIMAPFNDLRVPIYLLNASAIDSILQYIAGGLSVFIGAIMGWLGEKTVQK